MRKIGILLLPVILFGCEKSFENVIDVLQNNYQVNLINHKDSVDLRNPADSLLDVRIGFAFGSQINRVFFDVIASDNSLLTPSPIEMFDISNNLYSNQIKLKKEYPNGTYKINYTVKDFNDVNSLVAVSYFLFNNGQGNAPPEISNTVVEPDTVIVNAPTVIFTSVDVADPNGQNDILKVFFILYRPNGTTNGTELELFDDGNINDHGDQVAGDGTFSRLIQVDESNDKGTYRFEFLAKDRSGEFSNILNHYVVIQ